MRLTPTPITRAMYPYEFIFDVVYRLEGNSLEATFETTNMGSGALPYYAGHHFYFSIPRDERSNWDIILPCARWGAQNKDGSVAFQAANATRFRLDNETLIDRFHLDFSDSRVQLKHRHSQREITVELCGGDSVPWYDVTTWTATPESDFFCVEPWLGLPDAIHNGHGLRWLQSGQSEKAVCRIAASE